MARPATGQVVERDGARGISYALRFRAYGKRRYITLGSTGNGAFSLTVNTAGTTTFGGAVGGTTALTSVTTDAPGSTAINGGSVTTSGAQTYNDAVTVTTLDSTLKTTNSNVTFGSSLTLTSGNATVTDGSGNTTFTGAVNGPDALTVDSLSLIHI